jgi:hypothetical protein
MGIGAADGEANESSGVGTGETVIEISLREADTVTMQVDADSLHGARFYGRVRTETSRR